MRIILVLVYLMPLDMLMKGCGMEAVYFFYSFCDMAKRYSGQPVLLLSNELRDASPK
jgi:hypothetical protein